MDESNLSATGNDQIEITRSMISQGQTFRLRLERRDIDTVMVELRIGDHGRLGCIEGQLRVADMIPASRALASLFGGAASILGQKQVPTSAKARVEKIRKKYPNAYTPWTADDDKKLLDLYHEKVNVLDLSVMFGRQPSAIRSRLEKILPPNEFLDDRDDNSNGYAAEHESTDSPSTDH